MASQSNISDTSSDWSASSTKCISNSDRTADYSDARYWETQYKDHTTFDDFEWYISLEDYKQLLLHILTGSHSSVKSSQHILNIGCGTSSLAEQLYRSGVRDIVNIDISQSCIEKMRNRCAELTEMVWMQMDATALSFPAHSFDVVIDKATSDVFMAVRKDNLPEAREHVLALFRESWRVLRPGGRFVIITRFRPRKEQTFFDAMGWEDNVMHKSIDAPRVYSGKCHVYIVTKNKGEHNGDENEPKASIEGEGETRKRAKIELEDSGGSDDDTSSDDGSFYPGSDDEEEEEEGGEREEEEGEEEKREEEERDQEERDEEGSA